MAELICRACRAPVVAGSIFCRNCHANLTAEDSVIDTTLPDLLEPVADEAEPSAPESGPACPHCGATLPSADEPACLACLKPLTGALALRLDGSTLDGVTWRQVLRPGASLVLGRDPAQSPVAVVLARNDAVSRKHAEIRVDAGRRATVADLNSMNGTFVDDVQVCAGSTAELRPGSRLRLGSTVAFVVEEP